MRVYMRLEELVFLGNLPPDIEAGDRGGDKPAVASAADRQCCQALAVMLPCIRDGDKRAHSDFIQELGKQVSGDATSFCPPTHTHTHTHPHPHTHTSNNNNSVPAALELCDSERERSTACCIHYAANPAGGRAAPRGGVFSSDSIPTDLASALPSSSLSDSVVPGTWAALCRLELCMTLPVPPGGKHAGRGDRRLRGLSDRGADL